MPIDIICEQCGETFPVPPSRADTAKFCNRVCYGRWQSVHCQGENGRHWQGGIGISNEEYNIRRRKWRKENPDKVRAQSARGRVKNAEKRKAYGRAYAKNNPDIFRAQKQRRLARKATLPATLTHQEWREVLNRWNHQCAYCGCISNKLQQEHVIPVIQGGGYTAENIVPARPQCNGHKGGRTPEQAGMVFQIQGDETKDLAERLV